MFINLLQMALTVGMFVSTIVLFFAIFKIPIAENHKNIAIISLAASMINYYLKSIVHSTLFFPTQSIVIILLLTVLMRFPIRYSIFITGIGIIITSVVDGITTTIATHLSLTSYEKIVNDISHFTVIHLIVTFIYLALSLFLVRKKIGFSFVVSRFSGKHPLKPSTYFWCALFSLGIVFLQLGAHQFALSYFHPYIMIAVTLIFLICIYYAYIQNKKILKDRYGSRRK